MVSHAPLGYFLGSAGPAASETLTLDWIFTGIVLAVCAIVVLMLAVAILRRRLPASGDTVVQGGHGVRMIAVGTAVSVVFLIGMTIYALVVLNDVAQPPGPAALTVTVTGYDWWWRAVYEDHDPALSFATANEIHIPVGVPVAVNLESADVIHAFWAPMLAGKTQMIPGMTNHQWLQADRPGVYRGQCTQYCGAQHAHMAFEIVAQTQGDFAAWEKAQRAPAHDLPAAGRAVFAAQCAGCHAVRGTQAEGIHGPDLTHLMSRREIAAGLLTNTPDHLSQWIGHAQELKPGCRMPDILLSAQDEAALSSYLAGLK